MVKHISSTGAYELTEELKITSGSTFTPDGDGEVVIDIGGYIYTWNGKNDQGATVENGVYYIKAVVKDDFGYEHISVDSVTLLTNSITTEARIYNTAGELVKVIPVLSSVTAGSNTLTLDPNPPAAFYPDEAGNNKLTIYYSDIVLEWNGTNNNGTIVDNGVYYVQIVNVDANGYETVATANFTVLHNGYEVINNVKVVPNPLNIQNTDRLLITFDAMSGTKVVARIYNLAGELIVDLENSTSAPNELRWNLMTGVDNVSSGLYIAVIRARTETGLQKIITVKFTIIR